jgi:hypothetical protein
MELAEDEGLCALFANMASSLAAGVPLHAARPLTDEELEEAVLGGGSPAKAERAAQAHASDAAADEAIAKNKQINDFLCQGLFEKVPFDETINKLMAIV